VSLDPTCIVQVPCRRISLLTHLVQCLCVAVAVSEVGGPVVEGYLFIYIYHIDIAIVCLDPTSSSMHLYALGTQAVLVHLLPCAVPVCGGVGG
jgi:hypothetical protein